MITWDLNAIDRYYQVYISRHPADGELRKWWDGLSMDEQTLIATGHADQVNYQKDRAASKLSGEEYGSNQ